MARRHHCSRDVGQTSPQNGLSPAGPEEAQVPVCTRLLAQDLPEPDKALQLLCRCFACTSWQLPHDQKARAASHCLQHEAVQVIMATSEAQPGPLSGMQSTYILPYFWNNKGLASACSCSVTSIVKAAGQAKLTTSVRLATVLSACLVDLWSIYPMQADPPAVDLRCRPSS